MRKNYSIYAHAVHSRLQLIRNKLDFSLGMSVGEMIRRNEKYFELIADSITTYHNHKPGLSEFYDAGEMFMSTVNDDEDRIKSQPDWKPKEK